MFTKDSNAVVVGKNDGVAVLEIPSGQELKTYGPLSSYPVAVAVSADGRWIAAAPFVDNPSGGTVHIWDAASGAEVQVDPPDRGRVGHVPLIQPGRPAAGLGGVRRQDQDLGHRERPGALDAERAHELDLEDAFQPRWPANPFLRPRQDAPDLGRQPA